MAWIGAAISTAGGLLGGLLGGGDDEQTATQSNEPWAGMAPYLQRQYALTQSLQEQPRYYYPYQTYAQRAPLTDAGQQALLAYAANLMPGIAESGLQGAASMLNAPDVANNPYVNNMISAQGQGITDQLTRNWLPSIRGGAQQAGQYGGTRQGIAEGLAMGEASKAFANAAAQTQMGAYGQGLDAQARALQLLPGLSQLGMSPAMLFGQVGNEQEAYRQKMLDDQVARWNYAMQEPYDRTAWAGQIYNQSPNYSTQTNTISGGGSSPWATGIGTGLSLYGAGQESGLWNQIGDWFKGSSATSGPGYSNMGAGNFLYDTSGFFS